MWRLTLARDVLFLLSAEYSAVTCGASPGLLSNLTVASSQHDRLRALKLWFQICVMCRSFSFPDSVAQSCCEGARCLGPKGWLHTYEMVAEHFVSPNLSVVIVKCWFLGFVVQDRIFICSVFTATLTKMTRSLIVY